MFFLGVEEVGKLGTSGGLISLEGECVATCDEAELTLSCFSSNAALLLLRGTVAEKLSVRKEEVY